MRIIEVLYKWNSIMYAPHPQFSCNSKDVKSAVFDEKTLEGLKNTIKEFIESENYRKSLNIVKNVERKCMNKSFIYKYWNSVELGREMVKSVFINESDLLFLIPNNIKRKHGLPATRITGRHKKITKRKRRILNFKLFDIVDDIIEKRLPSYIKKSFDTFTDIKELQIGIKNEFNF